MTKGRLYVGKYDPPAERTPSGLTIASQPISEYAAALIYGRGNRAYYYADTIEAVVTQAIKSLRPAVDPIEMIQKEPRSRSLRTLREQGYVALSGHDYVEAICAARAAAAPTKALKEVSVTVAQKKASQATA